MPRTPRAIFPGVPHHITQRGNHRERVFHAVGDSEAYLDLLHAYGRRLELAIYAYCLMPNHVHLVVIPATQESMHRTLQAVHSQFAQRVNRMRGIGGHLWQGRYHSSALDSDHFLNAIRYVERNPVEAKLVARAEDYRWSSAATHCGMRNDSMLEPASTSSLLRGIADWSSWLSQKVPDESLKVLRRNLRLGLPCGSDSFVAELGRTIGRDLRYHPHGGQRKTKGSDRCTNMKGSDPFD